MMRSVSLRVAVLALLCTLAAPGFPEEADYSETWDPPPPVEAAILAGPWNGPEAAIFHWGSLAGIASGLALSGWGIATLFSAAGDGFDAVPMHCGVLMAVSGTIIASVFAVLFDSTAGSFQ